MSPEFRTYVTNLNRVSFAQLLDDHALNLRMANCRASLIVNPLSGRHYAAPKTGIPSMAGTRAVRQV